MPPNELNKLHPMFYGPMPVGVTDDNMEESIKHVVGCCRRILQKAHSTDRTLAVNIHMSTYVDDYYLHVDIFCDESFKNNVPKEISRELDTLQFLTMEYDNIK